MSAVRPTDGSVRAHLPALELTAVAGSAAPSGWPRRPPVPDDVARDLLRRGELELVGRMPWSSNGTFLASLGDERGEMLVIYKPRRGERPLWDFPTGTLCQREVAAFKVSEAFGWDIVPDTVLRDGTLGIGSVQRFVDHDPEEHYFTLLETHADVLRRFGVFDIVINNTDRKGGHCLLGEDGALAIVMKKNAVACVSFEGSPRAGGAVLRWLATPRMLRGLRPD